MENLDWTKINNDMYGNPRYVVHFLALLTNTEKMEYDISRGYEIAVKRSNKINGKKFHNKQYGGGIVFSSYNLEATEKQIEFILLKEGKK